ncbi:MAG: cbb3-type cytochrome oxidase assembly protein CcoS [Acetobacteraceae bacterium]|nr:cbb3-type cytochrome oxidase assembly protein CcoS [Acetobacteraceae bacterium]
MTAILWLIVLSVSLGGGGLALFLWASRSGQYDDMDGAAQRILFDDPPESPQPESPQPEPPQPEKR